MHYDNLIDTLQIKGKRLSLKYLKISGWFASLTMVSSQSVLAGKTGLLRVFIYSVGTERYMQSDWKLLKWVYNSEFLHKSISLSPLTIIEPGDFAHFCRPCPSPYKGQSIKGYPPKCLKALGKQINLAVSRYYRKFSSFIINIYALRELISKQQNPEVPHGTARITE